MNSFLQTQAGRKLVERDIPRIADALERIADALTKDENVDKNTFVNMYNYYPKIIQPLTPSTGTKFQVLKDYKTDVEGDNSKNVFRKGNRLIVTQNNKGYIRFELIDKNIRGTDIFLKSYKEITDKNILKIIQ